MSTPFFQIGKNSIGLDHPTYFIADIASNHGGDLNTARELIELAAASGANAAKFQHFTAEGLVSKVGFNAFEDKLAHQKNWDKPAFEVYKQVEVPQSWTKILADTAKNCGIDFFTAPYSLSSIDEVDPYVTAFKIGSGDITWIESVSKMASKGKPVLLATGASEMSDVDRAVAAIKSHGVPLVVMQCNTNYTGLKENISYSNLKVIETYKKRFPYAVVGLSDHTAGHLTVLGAVTLGARVIEKHFTSENAPNNPDKHFSLQPKAWREMVDATRQLEAALGNGSKKIEDNEIESVIAQRRCIRFKRNIEKGNIITPADLTFLRPSPVNALPPYRVAELLGRVLSADVVEEQVVDIALFEPN